MELKPPIADILIVPFLFRYRDTIVTVAHSIQYNNCAVQVCGLGATD